MVQSIIDIGEDEDRVLNIVKAKYGFKNKSQAVAFIAGKYRDSFLEPEISPEFLEKLEKIKKQKGMRFNNFDDFKIKIEKDA